MEGLVIEKSVPIPGKRCGDKSIKATILKMEVGDSLVLPFKQTHATRHFYIALGRGNFTTRKIDDTHTRCWRIK